MPVPQTPTTPRCLWACGRDRVPLRPRLLASQAGDDASTKETASSSALMSQSAIVLYVPTPQMFSYWQAAACPRAARKSATYRNPRSPILAALVPSVGTMMLQINGLRAGAHERPGIRASLTDPWSHPGQGNSSATMTVPHYISENQSDMRGIKHGWYAIEDDGNLSSGPFPSFEECLTEISQPANGMMAPNLQQGPN